MAGNTSVPQDVILRRGVGGGGGGSGGGGGGGGGGRLLSMAGNISVPQDVITDILSRLPVKSLIRFKAVSKTWRRLIQTPDFISSHLRFSTSNPALLASRSNSTGKNFSMSLIDSVTTVDYLELPFLEDRHQYASVVGTINGLVCVSRSPLDNLFLLWNPATKAYRNFPKPLINGQCTGSKTKTSIGFGYDCAADDYKLVRIVYMGSNLSSAQVEVLSWRTGSWRVIQDVDLPYKASDFTALKTVNGESFWYAEDDDDDGFLLSFNLHDEVFRKVPIPEDDDDDYEQGVLHSIRFDVWKESPAFWVFFEMTGVRNKLFDVWVIDDHDERWRRVFRLELKLGPGFQLLEPYIIWSDSEIVLKSRTGAMYFFDLNTNKLKLNKRSAIRGVFEAYYLLKIDAFKYVPSLVSVYGGGEV